MLVPNSRHNAQAKQGILGAPRMRQSLTEIAMIHDIVAPLFAKYQAVPPSSERCERPAILGHSPPERVRSPLMTNRRHFLLKSATGLAAIILPKATRAAEFPDLRGHVIVERYDAIFSLPTGWLYFRPQDVQAIAADGAGRHLLATLVDANLPDFCVSGSCTLSPDGRYLAFCRHRKPLPTRGGIGASLLRQDVALYS